MTLPAYSVSSDGKLMPLNEAANNLGPKAATSIKSVLDTGTTVIAKPLGQ